MLPGFRPVWALQSPWAQGKAVVSRGMELGPHFQNFPPHRCCHPQPRRPHGGPCAPAPASEAGGRGGRGPDPGLPVASLPPLPPGRCARATRGTGAAPCPVPGLAAARGAHQGADAGAAGARAVPECPPRGHPGLGVQSKAPEWGGGRGPAGGALGDAVPGTEVPPAAGDTRAVRPYKQEPGSPPPAPPAPGLPVFLAAPGAASCPECGKTPLKPAHLQRHRQSHSSEKPHACPECGKAFRRKEHLRRHRGTHPGGPGPALRPLPAREKPHACCECGKTFYWREHLVRHRKTHSGARPFACWECGKGFGRREHVLRHQRIHGRAAASAQGTATPVPEGGGSFPPWPLG
uniref:Zinc finger protein 444 n=1 Tax=Urocitellus parryii TaxID=9999 RepID=A0A8D2IBM2_UROPR